MHGLSHKPELLLYASADGQRPSFSPLFSRTTLLNSLSDLWNSVLKEPRTSACYAQIVDETPSPQETARTALELSLLKVKPFDLGAFEQLLESQEQVYQPEEAEMVFVDPLSRFIAVDSQRRRRGDSFPLIEKQKRHLLLVEAYLQPDPSNELREQSLSYRRLHGRDCVVGDFRRGLQGLSELFRVWDQWLGERSLHTSSFERIFVYSHIKGLLPGCWEELRSRGVAPDQVRLPQWAGYANALSSYWEFLLADSARTAFLFVAGNGRCHFADCSRGLPQAREKGAVP
jgi:hypothetical protein